MKAMKFFEKYFIIIFFIIYFFIGFSIVGDYGISVDEEFQRYSGFYWLCYVLEFLPFDQIKSQALLRLDEIGGGTLPEPTDFPFYGIFFDLPLAFIETVLNIEQSKKYFLLRHQLTFLIFFLSSIYFYKLLYCRFNSKVIILLGVLLYISSPRIFGDSFFNNKDLIFLSFVTISFYYYLKLIDNFNYKNTLFFSLATAITCSLRILGIFIPLSFFCVLLIKKNVKNKFTFAFVYILVFVLLLIILWPFLWSSPVTNFYHAITTFSKYDNLTIQILFNGKYIFSNYLPMTYLPTWILITTPLISIILFLIGYLYLFRRFYMRLISIDSNFNSNDFWRGKKEEKDFIIFLNFSLVFFYIIFFSPVLYTGWRHLYFLHSFMSYISCVALFLISIKFQKKIIIISLSLLILTNFYEIKKFHPFQSLYFNQLLQDFQKKDFEVDYWGIAGVRFLEELLEIEKDNKKIKIATASYLPLERSLRFLEDSDKKKFDLLGQEYKNADYIFNNNMSEVNKFKNGKYSIPKNFKKISEFRLRGYMIYETFKRF